MLRQTIVVANLDDLPGYDPFSQNGANVNFDYLERLQRSDERFRAAPLTHMLHYERFMRRSEKVGPDRLLPDRPARRLSPIARSKSGDDIG
jgi:hypothetical protein